MPEPLTQEEWNELLTERDPFKLAIRGATAIEAETTEAISESFVGDAPNSFKRSQLLSACAPRRARGSPREVRADVRGA